ncbi:hypothetical protein A8B98_22665 [Hymenobacter sp. UV11]|nr:hypothetical protein A8B98_22665 [Hymenobacter sp. UV11]
MAHESVENIISTLGITPYKSILVLAGGAKNLDNALISNLTLIFKKALASAAAEAGAIIIDGGTHAGVMALMGESVASQGFRSTLLGVAPAGLVTYPGGPVTGVVLEPNHSHFVLVDGAEWGSETKTMYQLVATLAAREGSGSPPANPRAAAKRGNVPTVVFLVGGGAIALNEIVEAVRQHHLIIVLEGSGGLADILAAAWPNRDIATDDAKLAEILADGILSIYPLGGSVQGLKRLLIRELGGEQVLLQAWETFVDYDTNAIVQQQKFNHQQQAVILLGLLGTALAIGQQLYAPKEPGKTTLLDASALLEANQTGWWLLHHALILLPIALTVLVTATGRLKQGSKWLLLRAGAEAIKREIYRYRTRSKGYQEDAEQQLALRIEEITRRTMRTEANTSSLATRDKRWGAAPQLGAAEPRDNGLGFLSPGQYVEVRLDNQLAYFRRKAVRMESQLNVLSWLTYIVGGVGTYLAAVGQQLWIALSTALVAAIGSYLGYRQTEHNLTKYNQAATDLSNIRAWWYALPPAQQVLPATIDLLVEHTEHTLQAELDGWEQHMQNALDNLHKKLPLSPKQAEDEEFSVTIGNRIKQLS